MTAFFVLQELFYSTANVNFPFEITTIIKICIRTIMKIVEKIINKSFFKHNSHKVNG